MKKTIVLALLTGCVLFFADCHKKMYPAGTAKSKPASEAIGTNSINADQLAKGKGLFEAKCNQCHDLPKPSEHSLDEWGDILPKMFKKAELDHANSALVRAYVLANVKA